MNETKSLSRDHAALSEVYSTHLVGRLNQVMEDVQRIYKRVSVVYIRHTAHDAVRRLVGIARDRIAVSWQVPTIVLVELIALECLHSAVAVVVVPPTFLATAAVSIRAGCRLNEYEFTDSITVKFSAPSCLLRSLAITHIPLFIELSWRSCIPRKFLYARTTANSFGNVVSITFD